MNPSERIKAALARPEAARSSTQTPTLKPPTEVETTLPLLGATDANRVARASNTPSSRTPVLESTEKATPAPTAVIEKKLIHTRHMFLALAALILVAVSAVLYRQRAAIPGTAAASTTLQMQVRQESAGLLSVRWNPQSTPVMRARDGRLVIQEANQQPRIVQLQAEELKIGHVYYQSNAERQEIRLEVNDGSGGIVKESVLAVSPNAAAANPAPSQPAPAGNPAAKTQNAAKTDIRIDKPSPLAAQTSTSVPPPAVVTPEVVQPSQPAPRTFTPPPTATTQRPVEEARTVLLEPSPTLPAGVATPARVSLPQIGAVPAPPVRTPAAQQAATTNQAPVSVGGSVEPATLLKKVAPVYPAIARTARIQGTVKFTALIDKSGRVQNLQYVSGPQMLMDAASDAVKKWVYHPMMLNGKPSDVITQIEVKFSLGQ